MRDNAIETSALRSRPVVISRKPKPRHIGRYSADGTRLSWLMAAVTILLWLYGWLPSLINLVQRGRGGNIVGSDIVANTAGADAVAKLLQYLIIAAAALLIMVGVTRSGHRHVYLVIVLVTPWAALYVVSTVYNSEGFNPFWMIFPFIAVACWFYPPARSIFRLIGQLTVVSAVISIAMGFAFSYGTMPLGWHAAGDDKSLIGGTILAGPYPHSNALGLVLTLGLPFVLTCIAGRMRTLAVVVVSFALLWSASRAGIASAAVVLVLYLALHFVRRIQLARAILATVAAAGAVVLVTLPLITADPRAWTDRGLIWLSALRAIPQSVLFGHGEDAFLTVNPITSSVGALTTHAHNIVITALAVGGLLYAITLVGAIVTAFVVALHSEHGELLFLAFYLVALVFVGILEDPIRLGVLNSNSFIVWLPLAALIALGSANRRSRSSPELK